MTLELCSNLLQLLVASVTALVSTVFFLRKNTVEHMLSAGFLITFALGILYWVSYQFLTDQTPQIFYVADISWVASLLFFLSLELYLTEPQSKTRRHWVMYLPFPIGLALILYFSQWGDVLFNVIYMSILTWLGYCAIRNLLFGHSRGRALHLLCIIFISTEYALWLSSCFWISDSWSNPYFWFDFALTIELGFFFPAVRRAVIP